MNHGTDREAAAFRSAYGVIVDEAPPAPSWSELTTATRPAPTPPPSWRRSMVVTVGAAAAALVLIGGVIVGLRWLQSTDDEPAVEPSVTTTAPAPTTTAPAPTTTLATGTTEAAPPTTSATPPPAVPTITEDPRDRLIAAAGVVGQKVDLALDPAGNPAMAYVDNSNREIDLARCSDPRCEGPVTVTSLAGWERSVDRLALAFTPDGTPVVAFMEWVDEPEGGGTSRVSLASGDAMTVIENQDMATLAGLHVTGDGTIVVAAVWWVPYEGPVLSLAACSDATCAEPETNEIDPGVDPAEVFFDPMDRPVWMVPTETGTMLRRCDDLLCASGFEDLSLADAGLRGRQAAGYINVSNTEADVAFRPDGSPLVAAAAWVEEGSGEAPAPVTILTCDDPDCTGGAAAEVPAAADSLRIGLDSGGNPFVVWSEGTWSWRAALGPQIHVARCLDPDCESLETADAGVRAGDFDAALLGDDTLLIAHHTGTDLALLTCDDGLCADAPEPVAYPAVDIGDWSAATLLPDAADRYPPWSIGADGLPLLATEPSRAGAMEAEESGTEWIEPPWRVLRCADTGCSAADVVEMPEVPLGWATSFGADPSGRIVVATGGFPTDGFADVGDRDAMGYVACSDTACSDYESVIVGLSSTYTGSDIATGPDGRSWMVYTDWSGIAAPVMLASCTRDGCREPIELGPTFGAWHRPEVELTSAGVPVVAMWSWDRLQLLACDDTACSTWTETVVDTRGSGEDRMRLAIGPGDRVALAFRTGDQRIAVATCSAPTCSDLSVTELARPMTSRFGAAGFDAGGNPRVVYVADNEPRIATCTDPSCRGVETIALTGVPVLDIPGHPDDLAVAFTSAVAPDGTVLLAFVENLVPVGNPEDEVVEGELVVASCGGGSCLEP